MFGRQLLTNNSVTGIRVSADGNPKYKTGGVTLDWNTVVAITGTATATLPNGDVIQGNQKYLRYGQVLTKITASGKFGPYDPNVADGRQTLTRGDCFILDQTRLQYDTGAPGVSTINDQFGGVIEGGEVWQDRILHSGTNTALIGSGPTLSNLLTAFPTLTFAKD